MAAPILATKLYVPLPRLNIVPRPHLIKRLNEGLVMGRKLTLISASAGFGKTMLVSEWIAMCKRPASWLSLDEGDSDPVRFISYLVAALQTIKAGIGEGLMIALQSHQPLSTEAVLTALLNEISAIPDKSSTGSFGHSEQRFFLLRHATMFHICQALIVHTWMAKHINPAQFWHLARSTKRVIVIAKTPSTRKINRSRLT